MSPVRGGGFNVYLGGMDRGGGANCEPSGMDPPAIIATIVGRRIRQSDVRPNYARREYARPAPGVHRSVPMAHKRVADVIVETLEAAGVKHCWGVPGDTLNFITDAIRRSDIAWVHVRHEEVGGFAAGAEAMLTGRLTPCAGSGGPRSP